MSVIGPDLGNSVTSVEAVSRVQTEVVDAPAEVLHAPSDEPQKYVHPESQQLFNACGGKMNCIRYFPVYGKGIECYGYKLVASLSLTYFLSKGLGYHILSQSYNAMYMEWWQCNTLDYGRFRAVSTMGWSIKPFTAMISDAFPLFGYKKRWVLTVSAAVGCACAFGYGLLPGKRSVAEVAAFLAFFAGWGQANLDILEEGLYARKIREQPLGGAQLVSGVWVTQMVAGIISAAIQGPLSDAGIPYVGALIVGAAMALCIPFLALNWLNEKKNRVERLEDHARLLQERKDEQEAVHANELRGATGSKVSSEPADMEPGPEEEEELHIPTCLGGAIEFNKEVMLRNKRLTFMCIEMTVVIVLVAVVTTLFKGYALLGVAFGGALLLVPMLFWVLPLVVAKAGLYCFLTQALYINISSSLDGFYMSPAECNPNGPHFNKTFYVTICGVIGYAAGLLGVVGFSYIFSKRSYRLTFIITMGAQIVAAIFDLVMVQRWNLPAIPDHYFYVFGDAVVWQAANMLAWMPMVLLLAQLCPRGSESMVYAVLVGLFNFGQTIASQIGFVLIQWVWPVNYDKSSNTCEFGNLWKLVVFGHLACPIIVILLVFVLIPGARICDAIDVDGKTIASPSESEAELPSEHEHQSNDEEASPSQTK